MTCPTTGKVAHETRQEANLVRMHMERRSGWRMNVFLCEACGCFHLGRDLLKNAMRRERKRA